MSINQQMQGILDEMRTLANQMDNTFNLSLMHNDLDDDLRTRLIWAADEMKRNSIILKTLAQKINVTTK